MTYALLKPDTDCLFIDDTFFLTAGLFLKSSCINNQASKLYVSVRNVLSKQFSYLNQQIV